MKSVVTGGCGFIGSHLVERLLQQGDQVTIIDTCKSGSNIPTWTPNGPCYSLHKYDCKDLASMIRLTAGHDRVFHFAALADVRNSSENPQTHFAENTLSTFNMLEACRQNFVRELYFASSATVYGGTIHDITLDEDYPASQNSLYGASKSAGEKFMEAYSEAYGIKAIAFRFNSVLGPRYSHGCVKDFVSKLRANPSRLDVLGNGSAIKSFIHVHDLLNAMETAIKAPSIMGPCNVGHTDSISVKEVAEIVASCLGNPEIRFGQDRVGWQGDQVNTLLDCWRLNSLGWYPAIPIKQAIIETVEWCKLNP